MNKRISIITILVLIVTSLQLKAQAQLSCQYEKETIALLNKNIDVAKHEVKWLKYNRISVVANSIGPLLLIGAIGGDIASEYPSNIKKKAKVAGVILSAFAVSGYTFKVNSDSIEIYKKAIANSYEIIQVLKEAIEKDDCQDKYIDRNDVKNEELLKAILQYREAMSKASIELQKQIGNLAIDMVTITTPVVQGISLLFLSLMHQTGAGVTNAAAGGLAIIQGLGVGLNGVNLLGLEFSKREARRLVTDLTKAQKDLLNFEIILKRLAQISNKAE